MPVVNATSGRKRSRIGQAKAGQGPRHRQGIHPAGPACQQGFGSRMQGCASGGDVIEQEENSTAHQCCRRLEGRAHVLAPLRRRQADLRTGVPCALSAPAEAGSASPIRRRASACAISPALIARPRSRIRCSREQDRNNSLRLPSQAHQKASRIPGAEGRCPGPFVRWYLS